MNGTSRHYVLANGETVVKYESSGSVKRSSFCCKRTYLEIALIFVAFISSSITVALVIVLATWKGPVSVKTITIKETDVSYPLHPTDNVASSLKSEENLCLTEDCVKADRLTAQVHLFIYLTGRIYEKINEQSQLQKSLKAARLIESMDTSVKPCNDFFEYACGSWNKLNDISEDRTSYDTFSKLRDLIHLQLKDLLEKPTSEQDTDATLKAKRFYMSCINETVINERDLKPAFDLLQELGGWPVMGMWQEDTFDLIELLATLRLYNNKILVDQWVGPDDKNSDVNIIQLDQPELGMNHRDYFMKGLNDARIQAYEEFAVNLAIVFGANTSTAKKDMREMIEFEIKLANFTVPQDERRDSEALYKKVTIRELQLMIPKFNWLKYLETIFSKVDIQINETEEIIIYAPEFMKNMADLVSNTSNRTLANYLIWRIMANRVTNLPDKYRELRKEYYKVLYGSKAELSRWRDCVTYVNDNMGNAIGRMFISKHFDEDAMKNALDMIEDIREAVNELLDEVDWMDEPTKRLAKDKADAMAVKIGYPSYILNDTALNEEYKYVNFQPDMYFENVLNNIRGIATASLQLYGKPVDKSLWSTTPAIVNAFYSSTRNQIMFPAGILQPPFYSKGFPKSLNYGGIGMVIGHEITHGFDDRGRQYDKNGNLQQWWDDNVITEFKIRAQCMIDQYSNYTVHDIGLQLNGVQTQGENIADNGGLKEAYKAYQKWKLEHRGVEQRIPGLTHLNGDQLFFLNFAQVWCGTTRPQAMVNRILTGYHSPGRYRVIGTLQNSEDFSRIFNCPKHSYMNPEKKCNVW